MNDARWYMLEPAIHKRGWRFIFEDAKKYQQSNAKPLEQQFFCLQ